VKSTCKHSAHNRIPNRKRAGLQRVRRSSAGSGQCSLHSSSGPQDQARRPKFLAAKQHKKLDLQPDNKQQGNTTVFRNEIQRHEPAAAEKITLGSGTCAARASSAGRLPWAPKTKNRKIWATEEAHWQERTKIHKWTKKLRSWRCKSNFLLNYNKILIITDHRPPSLIWLLE
jgi:hypothetical protein